MDKESKACIRVVEELVEEFDMKQAGAKTRVPMHYPHGYLISSWTE